MSINIKEKPRIQEAELTIGEKTLSKEEAAALMKAIKLCSDTAVALASKLSKLQNTLTDLFERLQLLEKTAMPAEQAREVAQTAPKPRAAPPSYAQPSTPGIPGKPSWQDEVQDQSVSSELEDFGQFLKTTEESPEISKRLSQLRDRLMEVSTSHNPAFFEMGSWANRLGKQRGKIDHDEREELINKVFDWKARLTQS